MKKSIIPVFLLILSLLLLVACSKPLTTDELLELADNNMRIRNYDAALEHYLSVIETEPMSPLAYNGAARAYLGLGNEDGAIEIIMMGLGELPIEPVTIEMFTTLFIELDRPDVALFLIQHVIDRLPREPILQAKLAEIEKLMHVHIFTEATCQIAKTCSSCGEIEGETLPHIWRDANFQEPGICIDCNETEGEPLISGFTEHGYTTNVNLNGLYPHKTTSTAPAVTIVGEATFFDFRIFDSEEGRPGKEGYEYQSVKLLKTYTDSEIRQSGSWVFYHLAFDYYTFDPSAIVFESDRVVNMYGEDVEYSYFVNVIRDEWNRTTTTFIIEYEIVILAPVGYDGFMIALVNWDHFNDEQAPTFADVLDADALVIKLRS